MIQIPGGIIDIEVAPDLRNFPAQLESGARNALGIAGKIGGMLGVAIGVGAAGQAVFDLGNKFTTELGTLQAVSGATAEQLEKVKSAAMGLGNDNSLADTSAVDAAAAMTELAKGGFSVEQSMDAARGTLQLAAAAQIDAASAATIQSQALQAFGLDADYAAKAADVLANGANASSAEITDVAMGLQQAGAVANQFGVSLEDTVAGLGLLANAGIQGSDAGTLLKSAMLALTDQGKPAQAAIADLGLTIYDAQGQFVGFRELFGQLEEASKSMTPEMYQAATATLFGSDAMRLAGVAAEQGVTGWDQMRSAIERQGAAAEVAAAKTQGLPGAISSVQNAAEGLALEVYDLVDGPLEKLATGAGKFITENTPGLISGLSGVADVAVSVGSSLAPVADIVGDLVGAFLDLPAPIQATVAGFAALKGFGLDEKVGGWVEGASGYLDEFLGQMDEVRAAMAENMLEQQNPEIDASTHEGQLEQINQLLEQNEEQISDVAAAWATMEARSPAVARMGEAYRNTTRRAELFARQQSYIAHLTGGVTGSLRNAAGAAVAFGGQVGGVAAAGLSGLKSAAGGVISAFGGPWMVGLAAAGMAVSAIVSEIQKASQQHDLLEKSAEGAAVAERQLTRALMESAGEMDDSAMGIAAENIGRIRSETEQLAGTAPGWFSKVASGLQIGADAVFGTGRAFADARLEQDRVAASSEATKAALDSLKMSNEEMAGAIYGSSGAWARFEQRLVDAGDGGKAALDEFRGLREEYERTQAVLRETDDDTLQFAAAVDTLADSSSSADDRVSALKSAIQALLGVPADAQQSLADFEQEIADVAESATEAAAETGGLGDALLKDGKLDVSQQNARNLLDTLNNMGDQFLRAADAGNDTNAMYERAMPVLEGLARQYDLPIEKIQEFAAQAGLVPAVASTLLEVRGADQTRVAIASALLALQNYDGEGPATAELFVDDEQARQALEDAGLKVELLDETTGKIRITADNELALTGLANVNELLDSLDLKDVGPDVHLNDVAFQVTNEDVLAKLRELDLSEVDPSVGAIIEDFLAGRDVTLAELDAIDTSKATPSVLLLIQEAINNARIVSEEIDKAARDRQVRITFDNQWDPTRRTQYFGDSGTQGPIPIQTRADGGQITGGIPGVDSVPILAMPGEHVLDVSDVNALGGQAGVYRFRAALKAGQVGQFEVGGAVEDDVAVRRAAQFLSAEDGKPYQYAGVGTPSWDCSAYASAAYAVLTGRDPYARWFTTESDFNGLGFESGMGGPGDLSIGVYRGGGGEYSHMAFTLAGVPGESSSAGVFFGRNTQGASDPDLPLKWHLPAAAFSPPGRSSQGYSGGSRRARNTETWDTEDELKLDSARISVVQAEEDRDKALNDPKKSQADKDQAINKVAQAEEKVRKLEEQKAAAEQGGMAIPPAPELTTSYTDDELRLRDLERGVDEATWDRDEVYADPEAAPWERDEADDKLQRAINSLADEQREQRLAFAPEAPELTTRMSDDEMRIADLEDAVEEAKLDRNAVYADPRSTDKDRARADRELQKALNALDEGKAGGEGLTGSSIAELFGNAAKAAVQGQVEDALGVIGLTNGGSGAIGTAIGLGVEAVTKQAKKGPMTAPTFSPDDLAKQGPVVPGSDDWMRKLTESLKIPAVLRDVGGPLPHGMAGLNLSGETEWVQTAADRRRFDRDMEELAVLRSERGGSGAGAGQLTEIAGQLRQLVERPPIQHTSQYIGYEQSEAHRRERDRVDQYSRTYLRR
ncbi:phage tail tape measure protein [Rhodococcus sp. HM1]|uniref:phage tail tape measure protein n=1 Tax=Rhodococcus sp. HM1 TaxID=2937759 RepID=UPI00200B800F|nr:phage tail tape measure protein [Rhodococcus sp. HM1]MCK8671009.1 phage tail tape measure protein [Rhodococcus sp. HM1]